MELENGSIIYLSSDGFIDQNNYERKKYGTAKLISVLEQNLTKNLDMQYKILSKELDNWMDGTEQRDDITLLGVKL